MLMPYSTKAILVDANGKPIPQYFDPVADAYQPLYGRNGATRVELYDASGNPITVTSGKLAVRATEIESILTDVWNDAANALNVQLTGSATVEDEIFNGSVPANTARHIGTYTAERGEKVGFIVNAASIAYVLVYPGSQTPSALERTAFYWYRLPFVGTLYLPPIRVPYSYRVAVENPQSESQNIIIRRIRWFGASPGGQGERLPLAVNLQIRDTATYIGTAGSGLGRTNMANVSMLAGGNGPKPIYVKNGLDQEITVDIMSAPDNAFDTAIGTFKVAAGAIVIKTNQDFPGLDVPMPRFYLRIKASATPTTGAVDAWTVFVAE